MTTATHVKCPSHHADGTPIDLPDYLTAGKVYEVLPPRRGSRCPGIYADGGIEVAIWLHGCDHLNGAEWIVVDGPEENSQQPDWSTLGPMLLNRLKDAEALFSWAEAVFDDIGGRDGAAEAMRNGASEARALIAEAEGKGEQKHDK